MKKLFTFLLLIFYVGGNAQVYFEDEISEGEFINDSSPEAGFTFDNLFFPNTYDSTFNFWTGWAISGTTDITTPGFTNQYSAIAGGGASGTDAYAVSFASPESYITLDLDQTSGMLTLPSMQVTNSTYTYLSMRDGDDFAKKFGGETGDDPDFFLLTIKTYLENDLQDSILFYLADYRFEDNSQDYIVNEWTEIDFPTITVDSVTFALSSSDNGMFGMNTPAYFCADEFGNPLVLGVKNNTLTGIHLVNTLVDSDLIINAELDQPAGYQVFGLSGQVLQTGKINSGEQYLSIDNLSTGKYWIRVVQDGKHWIKGFIKN